MFSEEFLVFIFMIVMNLIIKSVKDKNKIKEKRINKKVELGKAFNKSQDIIMPPKKKPNFTISQKANKIDNKKIDKDKPKEIERTVDIKHFDEPFFQESNLSIIENNIQEKKTEKPNKEIKKDILRGIIYSEILSKPKSLRNKRKSI
jgi:hypothetical protein